MSFDAKWIVDTGVALAGLIVTFAMLIGRTPPQPNRLLALVGTGRSGSIFSALLAMGLGIWSAGCSSEGITVVSWGGSYEAAARKAIFEPFTAETGIAVRVESYNGGLAQIRAQVETGNVHWDVVDLELGDAVKGCDEGLLELIDMDELPPAPDGTPAREDYAEGTYTDCGGGMVYYSTAYAYNRESFAGEAPSKLEDFFDLARFPGRRGMRRVPLANLEMALMADGVPAAEVYATLSTADGVDRAFRKLDTIKPEVIWWEAGAQPPQMLADQEVVMSTAYNGRIFNAQVLENQPFTIVWDGQILDTGQMAIVAGTPRLEAAKQFLMFASRVESIAAIGRYIAYSPTRLSGMSLIGTHAETGVDMRPHMPSAPENLARALRNDPLWWTNHGEELTERFSAWLAR